MKKILAVLLAVLMLFTLAACGGNGDETPTNPDAGNEGSAVSDLKIGVVLLHNETVGYDENFILAVEAACDNLGIDKSTNLLYKKDIPEDSACYDACIELIEDDCDIIFADSFGHEEFVIKAAKEYPEVQFFHATGTNAKLAGVDNFHNAFASIYEGRYLAGVVAGLKLNQLIEEGAITAEEAKMGYISALLHSHSQTPTYRLVKPPSLHPRPCLLKWQGSWDRYRWSYRSHRTRCYIR